MELRHLRYFVAVAEELNFTRAAERLHIAQPPLSIQIRALEDELKVPLFERVAKRRIYLTRAGQQFLERARAILQATDAARVEARSVAQGEIGRLAVGYTASSMLSQPLPSVLRAFQREHPLVHLNLHEMTSLDQLAALGDRDLDIGVLRRQELSVPEGLAVEEWQRTPLVAAMPADHPLAAKPVRLRDLRDEPLILYPRESGIGLYWKVLELCAKAGFRPQKAQEARDASTMVGLVASGVGIAIVPADTACIALEGVAFRRLQDPEAVSILYLAHRKDDDGRYLGLLLEALRKAVKAGTRQPRGDRKLAISLRRP